MTKGRLPDLVADAERLVAQFSEGGDRVQVGIDVVSVAEFARLADTESGMAFVRSRFTDVELEYCAGRAERLAARWAGKEAVVKAIGSGFRGIRPAQIEIAHEVSGEPCIRAATAKSWPADSHLWNWSISLCHEGDAALAIALAVKPTTLRISEPSQKESHQMQDHFDG